MIFEKLCLNLVWSPSIFRIEKPTILVELGEKVYMKFVQSEWFWTLIPPLEVLIGFLLIKKTIAHIIITTYEIMLKWKTNNRQLIG